MAYPTVDKPYGFKPVNLLGGQVFAGSTRQIPVESGWGTAIFFGDVVSRTTDGTLIKDVGTTSIAATGVVGVFLGCSYINTATNQLTFSQSFPANTTVTSGFISAFVADDPDQLFQVAVVSGTTVIAGLQYTDIGLNSALVQNSGVTATGNSRVAILQAAATTSTLPMRIVDVVPDTSYVTSGTTYFAEAIVKFNAPVIVSSVVTGGHSYNNSVGL